MSADRKPLDLATWPVAILAGGLATRLRPITETIPKALVSVAGAPFIDHQLKLLRDHGFTKVVVSVAYRGDMIDCGYRVDFVVAGEVLLEIKAVDALYPIHQAQVLTYLKLSGIEHGLLINFNSLRLVDGLRSVRLTRDAGKSL